MSYKYFKLIIFALFFSHCISNPVRDLCKLDNDYPEEVISSTVINNSTIHGPISTSVEIPNLQNLPSAVATTTRQYLYVPIPGTICQGPMGQIQPCFNVINLSSLYGIGRAPTMEEAEKLAISNCKLAVENFTANTNIWAVDNSLQCRIRRRANCMIR